MPKKGQYMHGEVAAEPLEQRLGPPLVELSTGRVIESAWCPRCGQHFPFYRDLVEAGQTPYCTGIRHGTKLMEVHNNG